MRPNTVLHNFEGHCREHHRPPNPLVKQHNPTVIAIIIITNNNNNLHLIGILEPISTAITNALAVAGPSPFTVIVVYTGYVVVAVVFRSSMGVYDRSAR